MNIVMIGAGRVGSALAFALTDAGHKISRVVSRTGFRAAELAEKLACEHGTEPVLPPGTDLVLLAVNDDALRFVISEIDPETTAVLAHTAGSVGMDVFGPKPPVCGVFYPMQTFTTGRSYDFSSIPIFIEAANDDSLEVLSSVAKTLSDKVYYLKSDKRKYLHLAAVFSCNFVNHMYSAGKEIAGHADMDFEVLLSLIKETMEKAGDLGPDESQTGPAVRNDKKTIEKHLDLLSFSPHLQDMYKVITDSIIKKYSS